MISEQPSQEFKHTESMLIKSTKIDASNDEKSADIRTKNEHLECDLHTGIQLQSLICVLCNAVMFHQTELTTHMENHLNENTCTKQPIYHLKSHQCQICDYTASQKRSLKIHIDSIHNQLKTHKCSICDYTAYQRGQLKRHIDSKHNKLNPH